LILAILTLSRSICVAACTAARNASVSVGIILGMLAASGGPDAIRLAHVERKSGS
jgi:hypothetical protein